MSGTGILTRYPSTTPFSLALGPDPPAPSPPGGGCLPRPPAPTMSGTGILTRYPSTPHFCLALGPDSPSADEPGGGTLRVSGCRILTYICATQADILTSAQSTPACR